MSTDPALADCIGHFYAPNAKVVAPPVKYRPAMDELDDNLLRWALERTAGADTDEVVAYLRDCYRRLG